MQKKSRHTPLLLAAAVILVCGVLAVGLLNRGPQAVRIADETPVPTPTTSGPPSTMPHLPAPMGADCPSEIPQGMYRLGDDGGLQVAAAGNSGDLAAQSTKNYVVSEGSPELVLERTQFANRAPGELDLTLAVDVVDVKSVKYELLSNWTRDTCSTGFFLLTLDQLTSDDVEFVLCERPPTVGAGWHGVVVVGSDAGPASCAGIKRTILIDGRSASDPEVVAWSAAHGCSSSEATVDEDDNTVTSWFDCQSTLIHVQTSDSDPWQSTFDGASTPEFIQRLRDIGS